MCKKVLVLSSSPRKGGNSDTLCDQFIKGAQNIPTEQKNQLLYRLWNLQLAETLPTKGRCRRSNRQNGKGRCHSFGNSGIFLHNECSNEDFDRP